MRIEAKKGSLFGKSKVAWILDGDEVAVKGRSFDVARLFRVKRGKGGSIHCFHIGAPFNDFILSHLASVPDTQGFMVSDWENLSLYEFTLEKGLESEETMALALQYIKERSLDAILDDIRAGKGPVSQGSQETKGGEADEAESTFASVQPPEEGSRMKAIVCELCGGKRPRKRGRVVRLPALRDEIHPRRSAKALY